MHVPLLYILSMNTQVVDWGQTYSLQMHIQTLVFGISANKRSQKANCTASCLKITIAILCAS